MDLAKFFEGVRERPFGGKLRQDQVDGCGTLIAAFEKARWPVAWAAYGLATAAHETAFTMHPIAEYGRGKGRKYGVKGKHGQVAYGRGYVQLTWDYNYEKADKELGLGGALIANYDLAMRPDIAADIMVRGMQEGWFTGKANRHYLDKTPPNYFDARRIINGTDKAAVIAGYAKSFEAALTAAGYGKKGGDQNDPEITISKQNQQLEVMTKNRESDLSLFPPPAMIVSDVPLKPTLRQRLAALFGR